MKFVDKKGQVSAPFELFVAVIIMTFVVIMGYIVLNTVNTEVCLSSVDKEMMEFKGALEESVNKKSSQSFAFQPPTACFDSKQTIMKLELGKDAQCADRCESMKSRCYILTFNNPNISNAFRQKCVDLPDYTSFLTDLSCTDASLANTSYGPVNPISGGNNSILPGSYVIRNITAAGDTYSKICVWYRAQ